MKQKNEQKLEDDADEWQIGDPYEIHLDDEDGGELLRESLKRIYGKKGFLPEFQEFMNIQRQTAYIWMTKGGIPDDEGRINTFSEFINSDKTLFYLPDNYTLHDYIRPKKVRRKITDEGFRQNDVLQNWLQAVLATPQGFEDLTFVAQEMPTVPHMGTFFRWAFQSGGIPSSLTENFIAAVIHVGCYGDIEPSQFPSRVIAEMVSNDD